MPIYMGIFEKPDLLDKRFRGDVSAKGYEGWIELQSAQQGQARNIRGAVGSGANREATAPTIQEIVITKRLDSVSTALFRAAVDGKGKLIVIAFVKADGTDFLKMVLQNALIGSYTVSSAGDAPSESISLNFTKITYETSPKSPDTTHAQMNQLGQQSTWESYP